MKKARRLGVSEMRREYDFASMKGGVRGKYVKRLRAGTNLVLIDPELTRAFQPPPQSTRRYGSPSRWRPPFLARGSGSAQCSGQAAERPAADRGRSPHTD